MKIASFESHCVRLPFVTPMVTSYGRYDTRLLLLVRLKSDTGVVGWGECAALEDTSYFWEDVAKARDSIVNVIAPALVGREVTVEDLDLGTGPMSRAAVEMAIVDAELRERNVSLKSHLQVTTNRTAVSVAIGIPTDRSVESLVEQVSQKVITGIRGVKLKIEPGWDVAPVAAIREQFPPDQLGIIVDANESYAGLDARPLHDLSDLDVIIEQPLHRNDFEGHVALVAAGVRKVCLDESVEEPMDAERAAKMNAAHILCLKPSRLGGIYATRALQSLCDDLGIESRVGGMYSSALGSSVERTLAGGRAQSDIMAFGMRWKDGIDLSSRKADPIDSATGTVEISDLPGIGIDVDPQVLANLAE